jgi:hypothetical protein
MYLHEDRSGGSLLASMDVQSIGRIYSTIYSLGIIRVAQIITYISCLSRKCERMLLALSSLIGNQSQYLKVYVCVCYIDKLYILSQGICQEFGGKIKRRKKGVFIPFILLIYKLVPKYFNVLKLTPSFF